MRDLVELFQSFDQGLSGSTSTSFVTAATVARTIPTVHEELQEARRQGRIASRLGPARCTSRGCHGAARERVVDTAITSRTTYAALYAALGGAASPFGQGDGSTTFNVPNMKGRLPIGLDSANTEARRGLCNAGANEWRSAGRRRRPERAYAVSYVPLGPLHGFT